ncbi:hypothetical protein [Fibrobacter sp.]|uniref:hypothetical protein n=1 Tax=Fibrobacter sp. TaxID=35828 RepID=UPI00261F49E3|nr:hypothetical protein [Fibrobacter sp.]MDD5942409.1 hypothetical protein [Fibrobacter sp.]
MRRVRFSRLPILIFLFAVVFCHAGDRERQEHFRFNLGVGIRNQTPVVAIGGMGYDNVILRVQGMGWHQGPNDFWCGFRGSLLYTFFRDLLFNFDVGIGGGYEFAEAPNKMHQAFNKANNAMLLRPYNYKEEADISLELWTHLYGFYTQISVPAYRFIEHDPPKLLWGAGYMVEI